MDVSRVRRDFPILQREEGIVYMDSACQSLRPVQVIEAMDEYYTDFPACGGRSVHRLATKVSIKVDEARESVTRFLNASDPSEIIFTKNCTEAINLVARGFHFERGDVVLTTDMEHNSNHIPWLKLKESEGVVKDKVDTPPDGFFDIEAFKERMSRKVKIISFVHTNNVTGASIPAREVVEIAHDHGAVAMLDGAQAAPHQKVDVRALDVDIYTLSAHKMLGPSGMGVLYAKEEVRDRIEPLLTGGGSVGLADYESVDLLPAPERYEAGLMNYAGVIGTGRAAEYLMAIGRDDITEHEASLNRRLTTGIRDIDEVTILEPADASMRGGILPFNVKGMNSHDVAMIIDDMAGILIRSGMHCAHPFFQSRGIKGCARASLYLYNTMEECDLFVETMARFVNAFSA
jgi:cysteine desulfurase/selenocysteine lyase